MHLGKRIDARLTELGWERKELLERVPDLTPQRLSALIRRDSKRCELDYQISTALGVTLHWLNDGVEPKLLTSHEPGHQTAPMALNDVNRAVAYSATTATPVPPIARQSPLVVAATRLDNAPHVPPETKAAITELLKSLLTSPSRTRPQ